MPRRTPRGSARPRRASGPRAAAARSRARVPSTRGPGRRGSTPSAPRRGRPRARRPRARAPRPGLAPPPGPRPRPGAAPSDRPAGAARTRPAGPWAWSPARGSRGREPQTDLYRHRDRRSSGHGSSAPGCKAAMRDPTARGPASRRRERTDPLRPSRPWSSGSRAHRSAVDLRDPRACPADRHRVRSRRGRPPGRRRRARGPGPPPRGPSAAQRPRTRAPSSPRLGTRG